MAHTSELLLHDALPDSAVAHVLRHLSARPRLAGWRKHVPPAAVLRALRVGGSVGRIAGGLFGSLEAHGVAGGAGGAWDTDDPCSQALLERLLEALGAQLTDLSLAGFCVPRAVAERLTGLTRLAVRVRPATRGNFLEMIHFAGGGLTELDLNSMTLDEEQVNAVGSHCKKLRRLVLHFGEVRSSLAPVWAAVGGSLVALDIKCFTSRCLNAHLLELADFGMHCPKVSSLAFTNIHNWSQCEAVLGICERLGAGLQTLLLDRVSIAEPAIKKIVAACPAVEVDTGLFGMSPDCMLALGPRASTVVVGDVMQDDDGVLARLPQVGDTCVNIRKCTLNPVNLPETYLRGLFVTPKPLLRELVVKIMDPADISMLFRLLIDKVHTLETFDLVGLCPQMSSLRSFIRANGLLKNVRMSCWPENCADSEEATVMDRFWPMAVAAFLQAPLMESLEFDCLFQTDCISHSDAMLVGVADACVHARTKNVSVCVCERVYL